MPLLFKKVFPRLVLLASFGLLICFVCAVLFGSIARYGFSAGSVKLDDFINYTFAILIILSVFVGFLKDGHVRVNMFSKWRSIIEKPISRFLYALPFVAIAYLSLPAIQFSWSIFEGSREANGLGGLFLVKTILPITFLTIAIFLCIKSEDGNA